MPGIKLVFDRPVFHEAVLQFDLPVPEVMRALAAQGIVGGVALNEDYPELGNTLMVCATETKTEADLDSFVENLQRISTRLQAAKCPVEPKMV